MINMFAVDRRLAPTKHYIIVIAAFPLRLWH
jgi:hypothetical protein